MMALFGCFRECSGHGRLLEPPGRSTLWRYPDQFPNAPVNDDDNGLNCGGASVSIIVLGYEWWIRQLFIRVCKGGGGGQIA